MKNKIVAALLISLTLCISAGCRRKVNCATLASWKDEALVALTNELEQVDSDIQVAQYVLKFCNADPKGCKQDRGDTYAKDVKDAQAKRPAVEQKLKQLKEDILACALKVGR